MVHSPTVHSPMAPLPKGVTVYVQCDSAERSPRCITCFRCGEFGHYRSECHNFKTQLCARHSVGECALAAAVCPFAHGTEELRKPWLPKCVRVIKSFGRVDVLGCGEVGHTFRSCPRAAQAVCQSVDTTHSALASNLTE